MDLELSEEQSALVEATRKFLDRTMPSSEVHAMAADRRALPQDYWKQAADLGWTSMLVPESHGGGSLSGRPVADLALVAEELGAHAAPGPLGAVNAAVSSLARSGTPEQQEILDSVALGSTIVVWAQAESSGSWDGRPVDVVASRQGDNYVLNGTKAGIECALDADYFVIPASTAAGPTQFLLPADAPGLGRHAQNSIDPTRRFGRLELGSVSLPASAIVGSEGGASQDLSYALLVLLALQCADTVGATARTFELTMDWVRDRYAFGRPIGSYQALKHRLADHKLWLEVSLAASAGLASAVADDTPGCDRLASAAKAMIAETSVRIIQDCIQLFGGIGVTWDHDAHLFLRRATTNFGLAGTASQHRERLCALVADRGELA
jgi:alkylation response protein AidB-like acyl-CoA dehydrogenase